MCNIYIYRNKTDGLECVCMHDVVAQGIHLMERTSVIVQCKLDVELKFTIANVDTPLSG